MALFKDLSSFLIQLSLSSLEANWLPRPCLAYNSLRLCSAAANLYDTKKRIKYGKRINEACPHLTTSSNQLSCLSSYLTKMSYVIHALKKKCYPFNIEIQACTEIQTLLISFSVWLLSVPHGWSFRFFHPRHNGQWLPTLKDFIQDCNHYILILS